MNRLEIILSLVLAVSMLANLGLILYVRATLLRLLYVSEELGDHSMNNLRHSSLFIQ
jgi:hypothetical protein